MHPTAVFVLFIRRGRANAVPAAQADRGRPFAARFARCAFRKTEGRAVSLYLPFRWNLVKGVGPVATGLFPYLLYIGKNIRKERSI